MCPLSSQTCDRITRAPVQSPATLSTGELAGARTHQPVMFTYFITRKGVMQHFRPCSLNPSIAKFHHDTSITNTHSSITNLPFFCNGSIIMELCIVRNGSVAIEVLKQLDAHTWTMKNKTLRVPAHCGGCNWKRCRSAILKGAHPSD